MTTRTVITRAASSSALLAAAAVTLLALTSCAQTEPDLKATLPPRPSAPTVWTLEIDDPAGPWNTCSTDPAVANVDDQSSATPSKVTLKLVPTAMQTDSDRIVACLTANLTAGSVNTHPPAH